jgi:hypothetical protein
MMTLEQMQAKRDKMTDMQQIEPLWEIAMLLHQIRDLLFQPPRSDRGERRPIRKSRLSPSAPFEFNNSPPRILPAENPHPVFTPEKRRQ